jgi:hypothetical protein
MGSNVFSLIVGGIYEYLSLRGVISMKAAWVVLVFVWLLGVINIVISEWVWGKGPKQRIWTGIVAALVLGAILAGFDAVVSHHLAGQQSVPPPPAPVTLGTVPVVINQTATNSECANFVAGSSARIQCEIKEKEHHAKKPHAQP